jgi:hypothetical protein
VAMAEVIEFFGMDWYDPTFYATEILDTKYDKVQIDDIVNQLQHLNAQQKADIKQVLRTHLNVNWQSKRLIG